MRTRAGGHRHADSTSYGTRWSAPAPTATGVGFGKGSEGNSNATRFRQDTNINPHSGQDANGDPHFGNGSNGKPRRGGRIKGSLAFILGVVMLVIGAALLLYPAVSNAAARQRADESIEEMRQAAGSGASSTDVATIEEDAADDDAAHALRPKEGDPEYARLQEYNAQVRAGTGDKVNDPFAFQADELESFGLPDGIMGSVTIPALHETIPLYLGATTQNLSRGAGIIAGTSLPLGETDSNCVIAAHRGAWSGLTMFRDIESVQIGDEVIIETPWDRFAYRAAEIRVIAPDQVDALAIQPGRDLVTLFTCHPYGHNYQRYLIYCERDTAAEAAGDAAQQDAGPVVDALASFVPSTWTSSPLLNIENVLRVVGLLLLVFCAVLLISRAIKALRQRRIVPAGHGLRGRAGAIAAGYGYGVGGGADVDAAGYGDSDPRASFGAAWDGNAGSTRYDDAGTADSDADDGDASTGALGRHFK